MRARARAQRGRGPAGVAVAPAVDRSAPACGTHRRQPALVHDGALQRRFPAAVDGLRALLGCVGHVWPVSVESASVCAEYSTGVTSRGEVEVDLGQSRGQFVKRIWLEPAVQIHPAVDAAIRKFDGVIIGPGSFYTSLLPIFLVEGVREALEK